MTSIRPWVILSLAAVLTAGASAGRAEDEAAKGAKKKGVHGAHGVVIDVQKDKDKDEGTIVVKVHHKKKGETAAATTEEKKFRVNSQTKFEFISGKKGERERKPATFADVHKGEHVLILVKGKDHLAERVEIHVRAKGKKATKVE